MKSELIGIRLSSDELAKIDELIRSGDFGSRSEFGRFAIRKMLIAMEDGRGRFPRLHP